MDYLAHSPSLSNITEETNVKTLPIQSSYSNLFTKQNENSRAKLPSAKFPNCNGNDRTISPVSSDDENFRSLQSLVVERNSFNDHIDIYGEAENLQDDLIKEAKTRKWVVSLSKNDDIEKRSRERTPTGFDTKRTELDKTLNSIQKNNEHQTTSKRKNKTVYDFEETGSDVILETQKLCYPMDTVKSKKLVKQVYSEKNKSDDSNTNDVIQTTPSVNKFRLLTREKKMAHNINSVHIQKRYVEETLDSLFSPVNETTQVSPTSNEITKNMKKKHKEQKNRSVDQVCKSTISTKCGCFVKARNCTDSDTAISANDSSLSRDGKKSRFWKSLSLKHHNDLLSDEKIGKDSSNYSDTKLKGMFEEVTTTTKQLSKNKKSCVKDFNETSETLPPLIVEAVSNQRNDEKLDDYKSLTIYKFENALNRPTETTLDDFQSDVGTIINENTCDVISITTSKDYISDSETASMNNVADCSFHTIGESPIRAHVDTSNLPVTLEDLQRTTSPRQFNNRYHHVSPGQVFENRTKRHIHPSKFFSECNLWSDSSYSSDCELSASDRQLSECSMYSFNSTCFAYQM